MNLPLTTGINKYFALPFVYLFGNVQHLTFLFWLIIIMKSFWSKHFFLFAAFFICSWIFYWNILHRQDEFYYPLAVLYLTRNWYIFILYFILNRNWFVIPVETTIHFKNIWLGYCLYVPLIINYLILKSDNFEYYKLKV